MAKLDNYKGSVDLISGIRPKNNGTFPLIEAHDVLVGANDKRLDDVLGTGNNSEGSIDSRITSIEEDIGTGSSDTSSTIKKRLAAVESGKQDNLQYDTTPTTGSDKLIKSKDLKTLFDAKQNNMTVDSSVTSGSSNPVSGGAVYTALSQKQGTLSFDDVPTANSNNPVKSGGIKTALDNKMNTMTVDSTPTANSNNLVTSGGVKAAIDAKTIEVDDALSTTSENPVQNKVVKAALDTVVSEAEAAAQAVADDIEDDYTAVKNDLTAKYNALHNGMVVAATAAAMTNTDYYYIYTGSESGYTNGHWYYHNGTAWVDGGAVGGVSLDTSLTTAGAAADAKATGDAITELSNDITLNQDNLTGLSNFVDEKFNNLESDFDNLNNLSELQIHTTWVKGYIDNGEFANASYRIVSDYINCISNDIRVTIDDGYVYYVSFYNKYEEYIPGMDLKYQSNENTFAGYIIRIFMFRHPNETNNNLDVDEYASKIHLTRNTKILDSINELYIRSIDTKFKLNTPIDLLKNITYRSNMRIRSSIAKIETTNNYKLSDYILIDSTKNYSFFENATFNKISVFIAEYTESKSIIKSTPDIYTNYYIPSSQDVQYITISYDYSVYQNKVCMVVGKDIYKDIPENEYTLTNTDINIDSLIIKSKNQQHKNILYGKAKHIKPNTYFLPNGDIVNHTNFFACLDYIEVKPNTNYVVSFSDLFNVALVSTIIHFYDKDYSNIIDNGVAITASGFSTPSNAAYIRIASINTTYSADNGHEDLNTCFIEECENIYDVVCVNAIESFDNIYPLTSLKNKTWTVFGDSITEKNFRSGANYHDFIRSETGINVINKGVGGSGYKCRQDTNNAIYQLALKSIDEWKDSDCITCMAGINDSWNFLSSNMGEYNDEFIPPENIEYVSNNSVMACFNYFINILIENAPYSKIGIISPLPCYYLLNGQTLYNFNPKDKNILGEFIEKCKLSCASYGIPYLDLYHNSGLRPWDETMNNKYFKCFATDSPDGLHPNILGHKFIYPMIREFIKSLI